MTTANKVSLRPLGVVAAGATVQAAMRNLMRLKSTEMGTATASMFGVDMEGNKVGHFLVSTASVKQPFSPMTGEMSPRKFRMGATAEAVSKVLEFFGATSTARLQSAFASDNDESQRMFIATCGTCSHVSASDTKVLLRHCTLCGDGLPQDDEGEEDIGLELTDADLGDGEEGEGTEQPSSEGSEGDGTEQPSSDGEGEGDGADPDAGSGDGEDDGQPQDENLGTDDATTPQEVPMVSEEPESEQVDPDADSGVEGDDAESRATATARQHRATQQAIAAAQQARASDDGEGSDDGSAELQEGEGDGEEGDGEEGDGEEAAPEAAAAKGEGCASAELTEDSVITVNALDDVVAADSTPGNCNTQLVFIPSEAHASQHQWMALVNNVPAATVTAAQAAKANPSLAAKFSEKAFASGALALCSEVGIQVGLKQLGFQSVAFDLPIKNIVEARVAAVEAQADATASDAVAEVAEGIRAALSTSWIAHAKNFFTEDSNELKGSIFDALSASGVLNPAEVTESVFQESGEAFGRSLISRAFSLMEMDVGARNQITAAIQQANVNIPSVANVSMASAVADQLTHLGTSTAGVKAGSPEMQDAQRIRNTVQSLHIKK